MISKIRAGVSDHAVPDVTGPGFVVRDLFGGNTVEMLSELTGLTLVPGR